jgi:hypothetical protein
VPRPWLATVLRNLLRMPRRAGARRELRERVGSSASETMAEPEGELLRLEVLRIRAKTLTVRETDLPREVVDCIVSASQRWIFPPALRDKTFEYQFVLPVPPGRPALR